MKILWLRPDKPDNISGHCYSIAEVLTERGHTVDIRNATLSDFVLIREMSYDVIVGTTRLGAIVGAWQSFLTDTPLIVEHIDPIHQLRRTRGVITTWIIDKLEKLCFRISDHVLVVYDEEIPRVRRHASNVTKISLGVDYELFSSPPDDSVQEAEDNLSDHVPSDDNILIYVGGLEPIYNLETVVNALEYLDGWHFVVLGDGSQREWIEQVDQTHKKVHYFGTVPYKSVPGYLHCADVGISLVDDAHTLKVLEYGAARLPVVHGQGSAEARYERCVEFCRVDAEDVSNAVDRASGTVGTEELNQKAAKHGWKKIADQYECALTSV